jgi:hypothetical protein
MVWAPDVAAGMVDRRLVSIAVIPFIYTVHHSAAIGTLAQGPTGSPSVSHTVL